MAASVRSRAILAFTTGWLSVFAWLFTTASACIFCAQICVNIATLFHADYVPTQWQVYLAYVAIVGACTAITIFLPKQIPLAQTVFFIASVAGFVVFFITVLAVSESKQSARTVFVDWVNYTGWSDGMVSTNLSFQTIYFTNMSSRRLSYLASGRPCTPF